MTNEYTKSVDELARQKSHPQALPAYGAQGRAQIRAQAQQDERRKIIAALAVSVIAALCVGLAIYRIMAASS
jgi:hypothetical protein